MIFEVARQQSGGESQLQQAVNRGQVQRGRTAYGDLYFFPKIKFGKDTMFQATEEVKQQQAISQGDYRNHATAIESFLGGQGMSKLSDQLFMGHVGDSSSGSSSSSSNGGGLLAITASAHVAATTVGFAATPEQYKEKSERLAKARVLVSKTLAMVAAEKQKEVQPGDVNEVTTRVLELVKQLESYAEECALVESRLTFATGFGKALTGEALTSAMATTMLEDADRICQNIIGEVYRVRALISGKM